MFVTCRLTADCCSGQYFVNILLLLLSNLELRTNDIVGAMNCLRESILCGIDGIILMRLHRSHSTLFEYIYSMNRIKLG